MRARFALPLVALSFLVVLAGSCDDQISSISSPSSPSNPVAVVELRGPQTLQVNEWGLVEVTARDSKGRVIAAPPQAHFSSGNLMVLQVSDSGVVRGLGRGSADVWVSIAGVRASTQITVRARVQIGYCRGANGSSSYSNWPMAIGDSLRLSASYVDVNGWPITETPMLSWLSDHPEVATVSSDGRVIAIAPGSTNIYAGASDDTASSAVSVENMDSDQPATVRYAHAMRGVGPITFVPSKGDPVTLLYGESVERPIAPGLLQLLQTEGMPAGDPYWQTFCGVLRGGDGVGIYAVGGPSQGGIAATWDAPQDVSADSTRVRLVQASAFGIVYLRPTGAPADGLPQLCYFDPMDVSQYYDVASGAFDLLLDPKYGAGAGTATRLAVDGPAGRAVTMVLLGSSSDDAGVLTFIDP